MDSQLDKLKSTTKHLTDVTLRLSSDIIGTHETNFSVIYYWLQNKLSVLQDLFE